MYAVNIHTASHLIGEEALAIDLEASQGMFVENDYPEIGQLLVGNAVLSPDAPTPTRPFDVPDDLKPLIDWIIDISEPHLKPEMRDFPLSRKTIRTANKLGVFPSEKQIAFRHGNLRDFYSAYGVNESFEDMRRSGSFSLKQAIAVAKRIVKETGRRPRVSDFDAMHERGLCPSGQYISDTFSIATICDVLSFAETKGWDREDYVDWAVRVMEVNGNLDLYTIETLATRQVGPHRKTITNVFRSIDRLRMEAEDAIAFKKKELQRVSAVCHTALGLPEGEELPIEVVALAYLRRELGLPYSTTQKSTIQETITHFSRRERIDRKRAQARVESQALLLGVDGIVDPPKPVIPDERLYVEPLHSDVLSKLTLALMPNTEYTREEIYHLLDASTPEEERLVWRALRALTRDSVLKSRETTRKNRTIRLYSFA
ncbi:hypothetical protein KC959_03535 [Candidatus Saccharibacteria bacterium]|nr:hypothetical protein [Candidatus Saccharibacteria bacterium]